MTRASIGKAVSVSGNELGGCALAVGNKQALFEKALAGLRLAPSLSYMAH